MFVGGPEDMPIEGDEFDKSKPRVISIAGYSFLSLIAHFFVQDVGSFFERHSSTRYNALHSQVGGALAMAILGGLLYFYCKKPTHLSITLALGMSLAILFMSGFIAFSILVSTHLVRLLPPISLQQFPSFHCSLTATVACRYSDTIRVGHEPPCTIERDAQISFADSLYTLLTSAPPASRYSSCSMCSTRQLIVRNALNRFAECVLNLTNLQVVPGRSCLAGLNRLLVAKD
ncbi:hypothetical protein Efla_003166 [Eimeria flavescens]